jgi:large subunit ribosomal protein L28
MSRICTVTKKRPLVGNNISHANNKTKRRLLPNLQNHRYWSETQKRFITLRVSTRAMKTIDKLGLDVVLARLEADKKAGRTKMIARASNRTKKNQNNRAKAKRQ